MKASKKIIGASCALVAAVALSAGSTFAWFTSSGTVKAEGMKVQAATAKNLVIRETSNTMAKWATVATTTGSGIQSLSPASNSNIKNDTSAVTPSFFYVSNPEGVDYATGEAKNGTVISSVTTITEPTSADSTGDVYVVKYSYDIKTEGDAAYTGLFVSDIQLTAKTKAITKALRVGVVCGNYGYIYAPASTTAVTYQGVKSTGTVSDTTALSTMTEQVTTTLANVSASANTLGAPNSITALTVEVYIWYEGQDPDCTSANSLDVEQTTVSISFSGITTSGS